MTTFTLPDLDEIIQKRAGAGSDTSYTAKLKAKGLEKCAQKLGEEAVETVIAAVSSDRFELTKEAADLLYHLLVVLHVAEVPLGDVMAELETRTSQSGLDEKASRSS